MRKLAVILAIALVGVSSFAASKKTHRGPASVKSGQFACSDNTNTSGIQDYLNANCDPTKQVVLTGVGTDGEGHGQGVYIACCIQK
jgi:uncharacterized protein YdeI (BOF family)